MHCHLLAPGFLRRSAGESAVRLQAAETLLAKGRRRVLASESPSGWLFHTFGIERQQDWPVAPYSLIGDGGVAEPGYWLRADPVHMQVDGDRLVMSHEDLQVTRAEAEALVEALNRHFGESVRFLAAQPGRWYARLDRPVSAATTPLRAVRGRSIAPSLPAGADAMVLNRIANESQMLLFEHPANTAREAAGKQAINSVWLWGGGSAASAPRAAFASVLSDDPLARGLARSAGIAASALPPRPEAWLDHAGDSGVALIVADAPSEGGAPSGGGSPGAAHDAASPQSLERHWIAPLLQSLREGRIGMVTLHLERDAGMLEVETVRSDLRHFWKRRRPLEHYAGPAP